MNIRNLKLFKSLNNEKKNEMFMLKSSPLNNIKIINKQQNTNNSDKKKKSFIDKKIKLPKIRLYNNINNRIKTRIADIQNSNFFITDDNKVSVNRIKIKIQKSMKKSKPKNKKNDNNLNIDELIAKFDENYKKEQIIKRNKQRDKLNQIYGINSEYIKNLKDAKNKKYLTLKDYQSNILEAYSSNKKNSEKSIDKLSDIFNNIREETESVLPYPKINLKSIINHVKNHGKTKKIRSVKSCIYDEGEKKDDFEKEELLIHSLRIKKNQRLKLKSNSVTNFKII